MVITIKLTDEQRTRIERVMEATGLSRHAVARALLSLGAETDWTYEVICARAGMTQVHSSRVRPTDNGGRP